MNELCRRQGTKSARLTHTLSFAPTIVAHNWAEATDDVLTGCRSKADWFTGFKYAVSES